VNRRSFLKGTAASLAVLATAGAATVASRADTEARAHRVLADPSREIAQLAREANAARPWFAPLTSRQAYVGELVATGLTNRAIASRLGISERTTDSHVQNIFRKLDVHRRAQVSEWVTRSRPS
jgi:DNA-binding NarL/FixJ family response regulator